MAELLSFRESRKRLPKISLTPRERNLFLTQSYFLGAINLIEAHGAIGGAQREGSIFTPSIEEDIIHFYTK